MVLRLRLAFVGSDDNVPIICVESLAMNLATAAICRISCCAMFDDVTCIRCDRVGRDLDRSCVLVSLWLA